MIDLRKLFWVNKHLIICGLLSIGCNSNSKVQDHLIKLRELNDKIPLKGWIVDINFLEEDKRFIEAHFNRNDTSYFISFYAPEIENRQYYISRFVKNFKNNKYDYYLGMKVDTCYFYKQKIDSTAKEFIVGKYCYMNMFSELNFGQSEYYNFHKDSLRIIRGNDLPELLEIHEIIQ